MSRHKKITVLLSDFNHQKQSHSKKCFHVVA
uniref:Uncharacterized protein n=1 Tax=Anguilla anguilla TaxID=7936 RepID=A0A0E9PPA0_ANGAN